MNAKIVCGNCGKSIILSNARGMREHATGTYSFLCTTCCEETAS